MFSSQRLPSAMNPNVNIRVYFFNLVASCLSVDWPIFSFWFLKFEYFSMPFFRHLYSRWPEDRRRLPLCNAFYSSRKCVFSVALEFRFRSGLLVASKVSFYWEPLVVNRLRTILNKL